MGMVPSGPVWYNEMTADVIKVMECLLILDSRSDEPCGDFQSSIKPSAGF